MLILPSSYSLNPVIQILSHSHPNPLSPPWLKIREQRKIKDKDKDKILNILCSSYLNPNPLSHYSHDHLFSAKIISDGEMAAGPVLLTEELELELGRFERIV